ncbi:MAG: hypothetical protein BM564_12875 [Bacteroidetes bacterium MedPE-SWsnd-G2]|nr:MAG: hypothetical protein BM564_12875 [Bacteroidetes bacterium MedPE-SWsnd-G2]
MKERAQEGFLNKLIFSSIGGFVLSFALLYFDSTTADSGVLYSEVTNSRFLFQFMLMVLIAPVAEELAFRAPLISKSKIISWIVLLISVVYILVTGINESLGSLFLLIWGILILLNSYNSTLVNEKALVLSSIIVFALLHLDFSLSLLDVTKFIFMLASGALLTWVALKYNLKSAIIVHSMYNFGVMMIFYYGLQFSINPQVQSKCVEGQGICIEWQEKPYFDSFDSSVTYSNKFNLKANNATIKLILDNLVISDGQKDEYIILHDSYSKFDVFITNNNNDPLNRDTILNMLEEAELIQRIRKS